MPLFGYTGKLEGKKWSHLYIFYVLDQLKPITGLEFQVLKGVTNVTFSRSANKILFIHTYFNSANIFGTFRNIVGNHST